MNHFSALLGEKLNVDLRQILLQVTLIVEIGFIRKKLHSGSLSGVGKLWTKPTDLENKISLK